MLPLMVDTKTNKELNVFYCMHSCMSIYLIDDYYICTYSSSKNEGAIKNETVEVSQVTVKYQTAILTSSVHGRV